MANNLPLKEGTVVDINVPFSYTIGEEGPITGNILKTIKDCENEVRAELNEGIDGTNASLDVDTYEP